MKPAALFLSGLSAVVVGAFIRACQPAIPAELLTSFCGPPLHDAVAGFHQHCAGCVMMFAGTAAILAAALMPVVYRRRARAT